VGACIPHDGRKAVELSKERVHEELYNGIGPFPTTGKPIGYSWGGELLWVCPEETTPNFIIQFIRRRIGLARRPRHLESLTAGLTRPWKAGLFSYGGKRAGGWRGSELRSGSRSEKRNGRARKSFKCVQGVRSGPFVCCPMVK